MMIAGSALPIQRDARHPRDELPARFPRLARIATIVVAPTSAAPATKTFTSASTTKSFTAAAPWTIGLWLGLIDGQGAATKFGSVQRRNRLVGLSGIGHFHERDTSRASGIAIRHQADLVHRAMWLKDTSQFSFGRAVGQVTDIKVLHCRSFRSKSSFNKSSFNKSSFNKSSKLRVSRGRASAVAYSANRVSRARGGNGRFRMALVRAFEAVRTAEIRREASRIPHRRGPSPKSAVSAALISAATEPVSESSTACLAESGAGELERYSGPPTRNANR